MGTLGNKNALVLTRFANLEVDLTEVNEPYRAPYAPAPPLSKPPRNAVFMPEDWSKNPELRCVDLLVARGEGTVILRPVMYVGGSYAWWLKLKTMEMHLEGSALYYMGGLIGKEELSEEAVTVHRIRFFDGLLARDIGFAPVNVTDVDTLKVTYSRMYGIKDKLG